MIIPQKLERINEINDNNSIRKENSNQKEEIVIMNEKDIFLEILNETKIPLISDSDKISKIFLNNSK